MNEEEIRYVNLNLMAAFVYGGWIGFLIAWGLAMLGILRV